VSRFGRPVFGYSPVFADDARPCLSFLEPEWVTEHGLPLEGMLGLVTDLDRITPTSFRENPAFLRYLSRVIWEDADQVEHLQLEAAAQGNGHVFLF
jgi:hypothetical protein